MIGASPLGFTFLGSINFVSLVITGGVGVFSSQAGGIFTGSQSSGAVFEIAKSGTSFASNSDGAVFQSITTGIETSNA